MGHDLETLLEHIFILSLSEQDRPLKNYPILPNVQTHSVSVGGWVLAITTCRYLLCLNKCWASTWTFLVNNNFRYLCFCFPSFMDKVPELRQPNYLPSDQVQFSCPSLFIITYTIKLIIIHALHLLFIVISIRKLVVNILGQAETMCAR